MNQGRNDIDTLDSGLPENWAASTFGEIYELVYGKGLTKKERNTNGRYPVYGSNGVVDHHDDFLVEGPVIIIGRKGAAGAVSLSVENCWPIDTTYYIRDSEFIDFKFSFYLLRCLRLDQFEKSTAIPGLSRDDTYPLPVKIPPANEQCRIAAKIEELFSELDKGIENLKTAREQLKVYRQAVLNNAATGQLLIQRGYSSSPFGADELTTLEDVVDESGQGWSPRCLNHPSPNDEVWGVIKTTAIQHLAFNESENKQLPEHLEPRPHLSIKTGDILVTRAGPRKRVGVACLVRSCRPRIMLCDKAYRLRSNLRKILPEYLEMLLNSPRTLSDVEKLKTGISDSGVNLTQQRFLSLQIFVPSIDEQNRTLAELECVLSNIENAETQIDDALQKEVSLRQSILKKAFSGQLVDQDPNDEPASVLLERIKAEKTAQTNTNKKNKKRKDAA